MWVTIPDGPRARRLRLPVELPSRRPPARARCAARVRRARPSSRQVDHQRVVRDRVARERVPPLRIVAEMPLARAAYRRDHVADAGARAIAARRRSTSLSRSAGARRSRGRRGRGSRPGTPRRRVRSFRPWCSRGQSGTFGHRGFKAGSRRCRARCRRHATRTPAAAGTRRTRRASARRRSEPDVLAGHGVDQQPHHPGRDPAPAVRRRRPDVDHIRVADAVGEQPRHPDDPVAVARDRDVLGLLERPAQRRGGAPVVESSAIRAARIRRPVDPVEQAVDPDAHALTIAAAPAASRRRPAPATPRTPPAAARPRLGSPARRARPKRRRGSPAARGDRIEDAGEPELLAAGGVERLVGTHRNQHLRQPVRNGPEHASGAAVGDDGAAAREDLRLRQEALDAHLWWQLPELGRIDLGADSRDHLDRPAPPRLRGRARRDRPTRG